MIRPPANSTQTPRAVNNTALSGPTGLPVINGSVIIAGNGSTIRRASGAPRFCILAVSNAGRLTLQNTTVSGGVARPFAGGGLYNNGGAITLTRSTVSGNSGCGVDNDSGSLTLVNSPISNSVGCGLQDSFAESRLTNSTISGNKADGVNQGYSDQTFINSTISGNRGSGIAGKEGTISLTNSTVTGNSGGGINAYYGPTVTLARSLISGNTSASKGRPARRAHWARCVRWRDPSHRRSRRELRTGHRRALTVVLQ